MTRKCYCVSCGSQMNRRLRPLNRFDTYTGEREVTMTFICPNKRFWKLGHWDIMASTEYERGDEHDV